MKDHNAQCLRALVDADQKLPDATKADLLADLRAEAFWNERAPALNDELLALRQIEPFARLLITYSGGLPPGHEAELKAAFAHLDAVRAANTKKLMDAASAAQAKKNKGGEAA